MTTSNGGSFQFPISIMTKNASQSQLRLEKPGRTKIKTSIGTRFLYIIKYTGFGGTR